MKKLSVTSLGQIATADISFGDLTVFVGEQASGKSILLQLVKLILDIGDITRTLRKHGYDWHDKTEDFLSLYFGEGMEGIWENATTKIVVDNEGFELYEALSRNNSKKAESLFFIPAHRVMTVKDGWPRAFTDYAVGDPYVVKQFSEHLRQLLETSFGSDKVDIFPQANRMNKTIRDAIGENVFGGAKVKLDRSGLRKRIVLDVAGSYLPYMVWSTGQREFVPLLMGLYRVMPSGSSQRKSNFNWVVIEEPEMGLYPQSITALLTVILALIKRGYKVIVSTHSTQVLELLWTIQYLVKAGAESRQLLKVLGLRSNSFTKPLAKTALSQNFKTYYFSQQDQVVNVKDISTLDAEDPDEAISDFGGLTAFSTKAAEVVSEAMWRSDL